MQCKLATGVCPAYILRSLPALLTAAGHTQRSDMAERCAAYVKVTCWQTAPAPVYRRPTHASAVLCLVTVHAARPQRRVEDLQAAEGAAVRLVFVKAGTLSVSISASTSPGPKDSPSFFFQEEMFPCTAAVPLSISRSH